MPLARCKLIWLRQQGQRLAACLLAAGLLACRGQAESRDGSGRSETTAAVEPGVGMAGDAGSGAPSSTPAATGELCGGVGEHCCTLPLPPCASGALCDEALGVCASDAAPARTRARLCRAGSDCASNETCCPSGAFGSCVVLAAEQTCPLPDLAVAIGARDTFLRLQSNDISPTDCRRGCFVGPGNRRVLSFRARVFNLGEADAVLGAPTVPNRDFCAAHLQGVLYFELRDSSRTLVRSVDARFQPGCGGVERLGKFSCELMGIEPGFYEDFAAGCDGLDITGVPAGDYELSARLDLDPALFADADPSNNRYAVPVSVPSTDVTQDCPEQDNSLLGDFIARECGWTAATASCAPGELISIGCPDCAGYPMLRVCAGSSPCPYTSPDLLSSFPGFDLGIGCPLSTFLCPPGGAYTAMTAASEPNESYSCNAQPVDVSRDPLATCTAGTALSDVARECEWSVSATGACTPGESVVVGCTDCAGDPMLRVCDGSAPCLASSSAALGAFDDSTDRGQHQVCPLVNFTCPASANYSVLAAPVYAGSSYSCMPVPLMLSVDPSAPCSDRIAPGSNAARQCDWRLARSGSCTTGETVALGCETCAGAPVLRICDGAGVCAPGAGVELAVAEGAPSSCPSVSFSCPASGLYSAWVAAVEPNQQYGCTVPP